MQCTTVPDLGHAHEAVVHDRNRGVGQGNHAAMSVQQYSYTVHQAVPSLLSTRCRCCHSCHRPRRLASHPLSTLQMKTQPGQRTQKDSDRRDSNPHLVHVAQVQPLAHELSRLQPQLGCDALPTQGDAHARAGRRDRQHLCEHSEQVHNGVALNEQQGICNNCLRGTIADPSTSW